MNIESTKKSVEEGIKNVGEGFHKGADEIGKTATNISKNKTFGDVAEFGASLVPGVSEYKDIKAAKWGMLAVDTAIDTSMVIHGVGIGSKVAEKGIEKAGEKVGEKGLEKGIEKATTKSVISETEKITEKFGGRELNLPKDGINGAFEKNRGNSKFLVNEKTIPKVFNLENKTWGEILKPYGVDGIIYRNGFPDFSKFSQFTTEIKNFSIDRSKNFVQADKFLAGLKGWTKSEATEYRKANNLVWHEHEDMKTMELLPREIHNNMPHTGGVSLMKQEMLGE